MLPFVFHLSLFEAIFAYIMFNFVDSTLYQTMKESMVEWATWMCDMSGIEECLAVQDAEKIKVEDLKLTVPTTLYSFAARLIFPGALFAIIIAGMTRREAI